MTLLDALAAALRDRLLAGQAASMPGIGTLQRERVTARVEPQPDGSSLLLPPSETVAFVPVAASADDGLAARLLQRLGTPSADAASTLRHATDQLEAHLAASGTVHLQGIGTFQRGTTGLAFSADSGLLAAVAQPYEGMAPVSALTTEPAPPPPAPTDASFIDEETLDDDLDDVLAAPLETSDPSPLRAVLPLPPPEDSRPPRPAEPSSAPETSEPPANAPLAATGTPDSPEDETNVWTPIGSPARSEPPAATPPDGLEVSELVTPTPDGPASADASPDPSDLGWLDDYDADTDGPGLSGAARAGAAASPSPDAVPPRQETASPAHKPVLPKPPPIIAGPVEPTPKRGVPVWVWMLVPLLALAALFFWYRSTQTAEPEEPILTAELAPDDASERAAMDTLASAVAAASDSAAAALASAAPDDTSAAAALEDAAALEGEFAVEELTGSASGSAPAPARSTPAPPPARPAPARRTPPSSVTIDRPDLSGLSDADRESLTGSAPIVSGRGGFSWVVLSTRDRDPADFRARQYRDAGWRVRVFQTTALGSTVYRIAVGQFESRAQADRLRPFLPSQVPTDTWRLDLSTL